MAIYSQGLVHGTGSLVKGMNSYTYVNINEKPKHLETKCLKQQLSSPSSLGWQPPPSPGTRPQVALPAAAS